MDQSTQQNAALVEEMSAAANSLRMQAQELVQAVSVFKLSDSDTHRPQPAPSLAPVARFAAPSRNPAPVAQRAPVQPLKKPGVQSMSPALAPADSAPQAPSTASSAKPQQDKAWQAF